MLFQETGDSMGIKRQIHTYDVVVVGSGAAGLLFAIEASRNHKILILTKNSIHESNTKYAQGGIAAVMKLDDEYEQHIQDTMIAGDGLCALDAVKILVHEAPARIRELINLGIEFDKDKNNSLVFTQEGGHSSRRILHVGDLTGLAIEQSLVGTVLSNDNIQVLENVMVIDLIVEQGYCCGVTYLAPDGSIQGVQCKSVVLATGGAGQLFSHTTNPVIATGDGIAMAHRAGANIVNMEFIQFHPTAFHRSSAPFFLISEAVRGEGGVIVNQQGERFMKKYHPQKELAPRDIVSRAIFHEITDGKKENVFLDISFKDPTYLKKRFPTIYQRCLEYDVDITQTPIPVSPAAHYICGGVKTTIDGLTTIPGLYAVGEVACTGVHGANRLASNSLLESVVFAYRAAVHLDCTFRFRTPQSFYDQHKLSLPDYENHGPENDRTNSLLNRLRKNIQEIQSLLWQYAGIIRSHDGLQKALTATKKIEDSIRKLNEELPITIETVEATNVVTVARLVLLAAKRRQFNAGTHYNSDLVNVSRPAFQSNKYPLT